MPEGTLRKVDSSGPARAGQEKWGWRGGGWHYRLWKPGTLSPGPSPRLPRGTGRTTEGRNWGADKPERPEVPSGSRASVSRSEAGRGRRIQNVQGPEVAAPGPCVGTDGVGGLRGVPARRQSGWAAYGGCGGRRAADKAAAPPRSAAQWNEWAINSGQWAGRVAPLKSRGSAEPPLFACAAPGAAEGPRAPAPAWPLARRRHALLQ